MKTYKAGLMMAVLGLLIGTISSTSMGAGVDTYYCTGVRSCGSYKLSDGFFKTPNGEAFGGVSGVAIDSKGQIHVFRRDNREAGNIWTFNKNGKFVRAWGDKVVRSHGLRVDKDDNIWTVDVGAHQIKKYSPDGKVLLTLGKAGVAGRGQDTFDQPCDVVVASNGDIFVADGYQNHRVVHFDKDGKYIKEWGALGSGPGQFELVHSIVQDSQGRLLVADRSNARIQIFDTSGRYLGEWSHLGAPFWLDITKDDVLVTADFGGETSAVGRRRLPPGHIAVANARTGKQIARINGITRTHSVTIDEAETIYAGSNSDGDGNIRGVKRFVLDPKVK